MRSQSSAAIASSNERSDRQPEGRLSQGVGIINKASGIRMKSPANPEKNPRTELSDLGRISELFTPHIQRIDHHLRRATAEAWGGRRRLGTGGIASLSYIVANPGISQSEIVRRMGFDKSAVNAIVNSLEDYGWVNRKASPTDRRRHELYATTEGQLALDKMIERLKAIEQSILQDMNENQYATLLNILGDIHKGCLKSGY